LKKGEYATDGIALFTARIFIYRGKIVRSVPVNLFNDPAPMKEMAIHCSWMGRDKGIPGNNLYLVS